MSFVPLPDETDVAVRARAMRAAVRPVHPAVLESIQARTPEQQRSLQALREGTAVVTGQQTGLFGGPMYTLHKAAAAIITARTLEEETGIPCAPVFWIQDEDHDFDEIRTVHALGASGRLATLSVSGDAAQADCSVAHRCLGSDIHPALDQLEDALDGLTHTDDVMAFLRATHAPDTTCSTAFIAGIERLFARHGLLVVDPMHPLLVEAALPFHQEAVRRASELADLLHTQNAGLRAAGRDAPIHVRNAPLSFLHPDGIQAARMRVEPDEEGFVAVGSRRRLNQAAVHEGPHTTSALLRPVLQDWLLPTVAYVGGPGELRYLAQVPPLWTAFGLPVPLVVARARFVWLHASAQRGLRRLGLAVGDLSLARDELLTRLTVAIPGPDPDELETRMTQALLTELEAFESTANELGNGLPKAIEKTRNSVRHGVGRLMNRYRRTRATSDAHLVGRLDKLLDEVHPLGVPQERVHPWPSHAARLGIDNMVDRLMSEVRPFDATLVEIRT